jgi:predicted nucleic acid-binding protein
MIFVDTSAWYARCTPRDVFHRAAVDFFQANREPLITTDYVVDEVLTLLKARGNYDRALVIGPSLLAGNLADLVWVDPRDIQAAWSVYERFRDKAWSFTDCVSYAIIERLQIRQAIAFDEHFRQFGIVEILPR